VIKLNHLIKEHLIYEGLIHSVSKARFEYLLDRWAVASDKIKIVSKEKNILHLQIIKVLELKEFDNLLQLIDNLGWYISAYLTIENNTKWKRFIKNGFINDLKKLDVLQLEPKFDLEKTDIRFKVLYHITPSINDKKIQLLGLVPKTLNKISNHPERIYFTRTKDELELLANRFNKLSNNIREFSIYEVDIESAMKHNDQLRLFEDPNFENGIYTLSNIPPRFIKMVDRISL